MKHTHPLFALVSLASVSTSSAATAVWSSTGTAGANWSDAANWGGTAPVNGDDIEIGIPVAGGARITTNDSLTSVNSLWLKANLNEANGNALTLNGNSVRFTAGGTSVGRIGLNLDLTQNTNYEVSANTGTGRLEVSGNIAGAFALNKTGDGRLRLVGTAKTYSGDTNVTAGMLDVSSDNMLPFGTGKGNVNIGVGATFFLNNVNTQINGLNDYNSTTGTISKAGNNTRNLTLGNGDANGSFSGAITFTGGSSTIHKVGAGTQVLSGNVSTVGTGTVSGGALLINGTWNTGLTANSGGTIGGTGTISGAVTVNAGGKLAPGASIESLGVGSANIAGTLVTEYDGTGSGTIDLLSVTGLLDIANATVDFNMFGTALDDASYIFASYGSLNGAAFANVVDLPSGYEINYAFGGNNIALVAVPEPAAALLGTIGALALLRRRRN
ncbi:MAG: hypothetical protein EOP88_17390 [Verrucomicrobiaceae bacterium]|nr:MAG: hypothetical protein EOP88_17390 [Verrucomicrobiaceae bacterium]